MLLGYRVLELGQSVLASTDLVAEFRRLTGMLPTLREETVLIGALDVLDVVYLARHNGNQPIRLAVDIGHRLPAVATSMGKAMLAALPAEEAEARLSGVEAMPLLTQRSFRTVDAVRADLEVIRRAGYAVDDEQNTRGVTCFGVALPGVRQPTAVSTTLLTSRVDPQLRQRILIELRKLALQLAGVATGTTSR
ncbi:MAG: IclR family transcriptional regulator C-terminal domain-containing protein [Galbitalea sp.]